MLIVIFIFYLLHEDNGNYIDLKFTTYYKKKNAIYRE